MAKPITNAMPIGGKATFINPPINIIDNDLGYSNSAILQILGQAECVGILHKQGKWITAPTIALRNKVVYIAIGYKLDSSNNVVELSGATNLFAVPCPPHCAGSTRESIKKK